MARTPAADQHLRGLARLRRVRDRIDREYAQPLSVEVLARRSSLGTFSTRFTELVGVPPSVYRAAATRATLPVCVARQVTRPVKDREAPASVPSLA